MGKQSMTFKDNIKKFKSCVENAEKEEVQACRAKFDERRKRDEYFNEGYEDAEAYIESGESIDKKDIRKEKEGTLDEAYWLGWNQAIELEK